MKYYKMTSIHPRDGWANKFHELQEKIFIPATYADLEEDSEGYVKGDWIDVDTDSWYYFYKVKMELIDSRKQDIPID